MTKREAHKILSRDSYAAHRCLMLLRRNGQVVWGHSATWPYQRNMVESLVRKGLVVLRHEPLHSVLTISDLGRQVEGAT